MIILTSDEVWVCVCMYVYMDEDKRRRENRKYEDFWDLIREEKESNQRKQKAGIFFFANLK